MTQPNQSLANIVTPPMSAVEFCYAHQDPQPKQEKKWSVRFSEHGGYDCMTHAWVIESKERSLTIDCAGFGQKNCDYEGPEAQKAIDKAKGFARFVMHALNAYELSGTDS